MSDIYSVEGIVAELTTRAFKSKAGRSMTAHGVKLTDGREFEVGLKQQFRVGDSIQGTVAKNYGRFEWQGGGASLADPMPMPTRTAPATAGGGSSAPPTRAERVFPIPTKSGEIAIIRQNALTNAVKLVGDTLGYKTEAEDLLITLESRADMVLKLAYRFAAFSSGQMDMQLKAELAKLAPSLPDEE